MVTRCFCKSVSNKSNINLPRNTHQRYKNRPLFILFGFYSLYNYYYFFFCCKDIFGLHKERNNEDKCDQKLIFLTGIIIQVDIQSLVSESYCESNLYLNGKKLFFPVSKQHLQFLLYQDWKIMFVLFVLLYIVQQTIVWLVNYMIAIIFKYT